MSQYKIGIAYTVHNRPDIEAKAIKEMGKFMPPGAKLVIVDDASKIPFKGATFRFNENVGIAVAKNKCLELLDDCDHIFLFDGDTWPKVKGWHLPYIENKEPHLNFTFSTLKDGRANGNKKVISKNGVIVFNNPCGCMMYVEKRVLDVVGGMDPGFGKYSYEHPSWSMRIFNNGLTSAPFMDVEGSLDLFHSMDWACEVVSSVTENRGMLIRQNKRYYDSQLKAKHFIPYRALPNYVLTTMWTTLKDPQRDAFWQFDFDGLKNLLDSLPVDSLPIVFNDQMVGSWNHNQTLLFQEPQHKNPYMARWFSYRDFLRNVDPHAFVWCTDATDVEMLRNPFGQMKRGILYLGDEQGQRTNSVWLTKHHPGEMYKPLISARLPLLNAGLCGGEAEVVLEFCERMCELADVAGHLTDMLNFNWVAYKYFRGRLEHGPLVNTQFKAFKDNGRAWFRHK